MVARICNYNTCVENVGANGVVVSLKTEAPDGEKRAIFCCATHAAAALKRLSWDRGEYVLAAVPPRFRRT